MQEQEKKQASYLIILCSYTLFVAMLMGEALVLDWQVMPVVELGIGVMAGWFIHITGTVPDMAKKWMCVLLMMIGFFYYGKHNTSFYDLAPVMVGIILVYSVAEFYSVIWVCVATYFVTVAYDMVFVMNPSKESNRISITRLLLHAMCVCLSAYMSKLMSVRHHKEMGEMDAKIAELQEANSRTEDFLTKISHELRTPVNAVTGLTRVMLKNETESKKRASLLSVQKAGHRLFRQIEDILDYTEIDTGKIVVSEEAYMVSSLINDIITESRMMSAKKEVEVIFDVDAKMPAMLLGDGRKIKKIIKHLLDNAVKFTDEGGVYVKVYTLPKPYGANLCIRMSDTGVGMDEKTLAKYTQRLYQSNRESTQQAGGLGLGISIVYGMVASMEGFVHVESKEGTGTTVSVSIPQQIADSSPGMVVEDPESLCVACYLCLEKYAVPEVRKFYNETIAHMAMGLGVALHRAFSMEDVENLSTAYRLTHLFLGQREYEEDAPFFENLEKEIEVIVVADYDFALEKNSRAKLMMKPFYCFPVANALNAKSGDGDDESSGKRMLCPGVDVLVVDDEPMNRIVAEGIFKDYRMNVKTVGSGQEAIEACQHEEFDLIFLDHMMPGMDGVETLKHLKKIQSDSVHPFSAIAFTANAVSGAREMFLREGFDEFVSKPIEYVELERVLRKVLPKSQIRMVDQKIYDQIPESWQDDEALLEELQPKEEPLADEMARLERVGIHTKSGLLYCRSDKAFYFQVLTKFAQESEAKAAQINRLFGKKDYRDYVVLVHALKSTAKMVGADDLSKSAAAMESAAKAKQVDYIEEHHGDLLEAYKALGRQILEVVAVEEPGAKEDGAKMLLKDRDGQPCVEEPKTKEDGMGSLPEISEALAELEDSLHTFESSKAEGLLDSLLGAVGNDPKMQEALGAIRKDVEEFEFENALEKLGSLQRQWEGGDAT